TAHQRIKFWSCGSPRHSCRRATNRPRSRRSDLSLMGYLNCLTFGEARQDRTCTAPSARLVSSPQDRSELKLSFLWSPAGWNQSINNLQETEMRKWTHTHEHNLLNR